MAMTERRVGDRMRSLRAPLSAGAVAAAALTCTAVADPNVPGRYPPCPFHLLTGLYCPGCGTLRAMHDLTRGDLTGALGMNPLFVICVPVVIALWAGWTLRSWQGRPVRGRPAHLWGLLAIVIVYWVVRNMSFGRSLAP